MKRLNGLHCFLIAVCVAVWAMAGLTACGSDGVESSSESQTIQARPPKPGGPAAALSKVCQDHGGILDFEGRQTDGYTVDWDVVCRDGVVRVVLAYTR